MRLGRECFRGPNQKSGEISQDGYYQGQEKKEWNSKETFDRCVALELSSVRGCYRLREVVASGVVGLRCCSLWLCALVLVYVVWFLPGFFR